MTSASAMASAMGTSMFIRPPRSALSAEEQNGCAATAVTGSAIAALPASPLRHRSAQPGASASPSSTWGLSG